MPGPVSKAAPESCWAAPLPVADLPSKQVGAAAGRIRPTWTNEKANALQEAVDTVFNTGGDSLVGLRFSFFIADPTLAGCPLIGCSSGFGGELCGCHLEDMISCNGCEALRQHTRAFSQAITAGREYRVCNEPDAWVPEGRPGDEFFCVQSTSNADGTLVKSVFYLKSMALGSELGDVKPYIVGLRAEPTSGSGDGAQMYMMYKSLDSLDSYMDEVIKIVSGLFFLSVSLRRQEAEFTTTIISL